MLSARRQFFEPLCLGKYRRGGATRTTGAGAFALSTLALLAGALNRPSAAMLTPARTNRLLAILFIRLNLPRVRYYLRFRSLAARLCPAREFSSTWKPNQFDPVLEQWRPMSIKRGLSLRAPTVGLHSYPCPWGPGFEKTCVVPSGRIMTRPPPGRVMIRVPLGKVLTLVPSSWRSTSGGP